MTLETTKYNEVLDYKSPYNHHMERAFNDNLVERIQFLAC